jgi:uncharacterized Zn-binding protein involved in type VI secretion
VGAKPAARITDRAKSLGHVHMCPACTQGAPHTVMGPFVQGSPNVMINGLAAIRQNDPGVACACCFTNMFRAQGCSTTVLANGRGLVRKGDATAHCEPQSFPGDVITGSPNVTIED